MKMRMQAASVGCENLGKLFCLPKREALLHDGAQRMSMTADFSADDTTSVRALVRHSRVESCSVQISIGFSFFGTRFRFFQVASRYVMADHIFPDNWYTLSKELYDECRHSLKSLVKQDLDDPTKDVSVFVLFLDGFGRFGMTRVI